MTSSEQILHGFLGTSEDWSPIMKSLSNDARTIFVDLPGHGKSQIHAKQECTISVQIISKLLLKLINEISTEEQRVVLVGYSMGARIALRMALNSDKIKGAVIISGSPGLKKESNRKIHQAIDKSRAKLLISHGLNYFLETWYSTKLWSSLREHPHLDRLLQSRTQHDDVESRSVEGFTQFKCSKSKTFGGVLKRREKHPNAGKKPRNAGKSLQTPGKPYFGRRLSNAGKGIWKRRYRYLPTEIFLALAQAPGKTFRGVFHTI